MPDAASDHKPKPAAGAAPSKAVAPRSNKPSTMAVSILTVTSNKAGAAHVTLDTRRYPMMAVGMTGIVIGLSATVEITAVSPNRANAVIKGEGLEKQWLRGHMVVLEPNAGLRTANESNLGSSARSISTSDTGGSAR